MAEGGPHSLLLGSTRAQGYSQEKVLGKLGECLKLISLMQAVPSRPSFKCNGKQGRRRRLVTPCGPLSQVEEPQLEATSQRPSSCYLCTAACRMHGALAGQERADTGRGYRSICWTQFSIRTHLGPPLLPDRSKFGSRKRGARATHERKYTWGSQPSIQEKQQCNVSCCSSG